MKRLNRIHASELQDCFDNWTYRHSVTRQIILTEFNGLLLDQQAHIHGIFDFMREHEDFLMTDD
jgi:hypothetical protein